MQCVIEKIFAHFLSTISQKKYFQLSVVHTSRKIAYTKMYRTKKINQSIFKLSWVPNLAKRARDACENNERYDCKNARWIKKTKQCMKRLIG